MMRPPELRPDNLIFTHKIAAFVGEFDWSKTRLGTPESWSRTLQVCVDVIMELPTPAIIFWGSDQTQIYNEGYSHIMGPRHPKYFGAPYRECWPDTYPVIYPLMQKVLGGEVVRVEREHIPVTRYGFNEEAYFSFTFTPIRDDDGTIRGIYQPVLEVTQAVLSDRRAETLRALTPRADSQDPVKDAFEALSSNPKDIPFSLLYLWNEADERLEIVARTENLEGRSFRLEQIRQRVERAFRSNEAEEVDHVEDLLDASISPWPEPTRSAIVLPIATSRTEHLRGAIVLGVSPRLRFDEKYRSFLETVAGQVTTAMGTESAIRQAQKRAEALAEIDRAKTVFFSNVSHELRTPLTLILGPVEEGLQDATEPLSPTHRERQETVHRNTLRLLKLVNSLLDFSRIEAGRVQASYEQTDIASLTAEVASAFRSLVERAGLALSVHCPPVTDPVFVDRQMWEKIVLNLVSNAFKFTFEGDITVRLEAETGLVRLVVRDTGTGIEAKHLPHVFERFYRVEGARGRSYEGTGIGLALVRELTRLHGGSVSVESTSGKGTTVTITLPTGNAHLPSDRVQATRTLASTAVAAETFVEEAASWVGDEPAEPTDTPFADLATEEAARSTRLLVADDNADMRAYLARMLRPLGTIELVSDGQQALAAVARQMPDLVLSDVMMPNLDGFELVRALRANASTQTLPIVLLSAHAGEDSRVEGARMGADDYIVKPFSARDLVARVRAQLQLARLRREHTEALRASNERLKKILEVETVGVMFWDLTTGLMVDANDAFLNLVGYSRRELDAGELTWQKLTPPEYVDVSLAELAKFAVTGRVGPYEKEYLRKDGARRWFVFAGSSLGGNTCVEFCVDVGDRKRAEEALRAANTQLLEADRRKNEFLAVLSHELRNPLAPIANSLYILDHAPPGGEQAERAKRVISRQITQLSSLVNDLLDVTRITRDKIQLQKERVELSEIVRRAVEDHRSLFERARVHLEFQPAPQPAPVVADSTRIAQIVGNLLQNSAKFTPQDGHTRVLVGIEQDRAVVRVTDDGVGISPETLPRLFQPFMQAEQALDRSKGGLGLGLALVKGLVELHGGSVIAQSKGVGRGSEITVRLPLASDTADGASTAEAHSNRLQRRVLIIEDNADAADSLSEALTLAGHEVAVAYNGPDGIAKARAWGPDAVLCDIGLPIMDGYEVARTFRADHALSATYLVALSGYALPEDLRRSADAGFERHLPKPPNIEKLRELLAELPQRSPHLTAG